MSRWVSFVSSHLEANGWTRNRLAKEIGLNASVVSRWMNDGMEPGIKSIRLVAEAFGVPVTRALLAAGAVTADELGIVPVVAPDPDLLTDEELLSQLAKRMQQRRTEVIVPAEPAAPVVVDRSSSRGAQLRGWTPPSR
ncbi:helix-turn-helix domain-containing protein [Rhodococcus wratislaviensis]|uniref:helix-turn-helix domain-containing protein n=1 Tax=Rhodococcus wratislaviensis TaxID=44752 RepID=UPI0011BEC015|nr:helix-turn-helix transcriptional regulator [Rhodococcus wratislaviensis]